LFPKTAVIASSAVVHYTDIFNDAIINWQILPRLQGHINAWYDPLSHSQVTNQKIVYFIFSTNLLNTLMIGLDLHISHPTLPQFTLDVQFGVSSP